MKARSFKEEVVWAMRDYDASANDPLFKETMKKLEAYKEGTKYRDLLDPTLAQKLIISIQVKEGDKSASRMNSTGSLKSSIIRTRWQR